MCVQLSSALQLFGEMKMQALHKILRSLCPRQLQMLHFAA
jgi:hypothetical protein